jgi:glycosyltransferase involved in cell wall biosynthesis
LGLKFEKQMFKGKLGNNPAMQSRLEQIPNSFSLVTIGICTLNCQNTIADTLKSILNLIYPVDKIQVVIVDGNSKDDTLKITTKILNCSELNWKIVTDDGHGLGYARQLIVKHSVGTYVAFIDSDQQVHPFWLQIAIEHLRAYSKVAGVRGVQGLTYNLPVSGALENYVKYFDEHENQLVARVDSFALGGSLFKKEAIEEAGGFRSMFRFDSEDTDLAARLDGLGYKIHNLQSAVFYHNSRPTWKALFRKYEASGRCFRTVKKIYEHDNRGDMMLSSPLNISLGILMSARRIFKVYRTTNDKRCVFLPLYSAFKMSAWISGYIF